MASKKKLEKGIESLKENVEEHKQKIANYRGNKDYLKRYWEKEIEQRGKEIAKKKKKLEGS